MITPLRRHGAADSGERALRDACALCFMCVAFGGAGCSAAPRGVATTAFSDFEKSVESADARSLAAMFSAATQRELRGHDDADQLVGEYSRFLATGLRPVCPLRIESQSDDGAVATFSFKGRTGARGHIRLVREDGRWMLDLVGPAGEWLGLRKWARSVSDSMAASGAKGGSLAGIEMVPPGPGDLLNMLGGVPGVTDDAEMLFGGAAGAVVPVPPEKSIRGDEGSR